MMIEPKKEAWNLVSFASKEDRLKLHREVPKRGLQAKLGSEEILPIAGELVRLACASLDKQKKTPETEDECSFLHKICHDIIETKKTPAETLLEKWQGELEQNPSKLIEYLSIG